VRAGFDRVQVGRVFPQEAQQKPQPFRVVSTWLLELLSRNRLKVNFGGPVSSTSDTT
jgi:hypothetical protein